MSLQITQQKLKLHYRKGITAFFEEIGGEIVSQTQRNSRVDTERTKDSYKYVVDEGKDESTVAVGSDLENAIWEEFGTGEYALHGDGRKGGWYIPENKLTEHAKGKMKKVVIDGKVYYHTYGKKPNQPLTKAFQVMNPKILPQLKNILKNL